MIIRQAAAASVPPAAGKRASGSNYPRRTVTGVTCAAALLALGISGLAAAQSKPATSAKKPVLLQEVTVTGSRIARTTDFNTPTPTTVIDTATMNSMGIVNVGQALTLTPANVSTFTPANTGNSNFFTGSFIADLRGLNPYFGSRTLLLIDGQRVVNSNQGDSFDMNLIPQILVQRIDTVTGGASAAYGSGAIAGVMNVILNQHLEGGKLDGDFYQTSRSDGRDRHIGAAYGFGAFDNRIHVVIGGEYEASDDVGCMHARSWCAQNNGFYQAGSSPNGTTIWGTGSNVRAEFGGVNGVFVPGFGIFSGYHGGPGVPVTFDSYGNHVEPYALGSPQGFGLNDVVGGQGTPIYQYTSLRAPINRGVGMVLLNGRINDYLSWNLTYLLAREQTTDYSGAPPSNFAGITPQNAFACPDTANGPLIPSFLPSPTTCLNTNNPALAAEIGTGGYMNKDWSNQLASLTRFTTSVSRVTFGLDGAIGDSSWTWNANYEYGLTQHDQLVQGTISVYRIAMALDSVIDPATGQPACRVTVDGFAGAVAANPGGGYALANPLLANGCVPLDPFGSQPLSKAANNYSFGNLVENLRYEQTDANINLSGSYFHGVGAGPFKLAVGYEWRQERGDNIDQPGLPQYVVSDFAYQYGSSFGGLMSVNEEYLELNFPLFKNKPGAHLLEFDIAGRESEYDNSALYGIDVTPGTVGKDVTHNFPTWKFSAIYNPVSWLRLRATQSRDERAPNFRELYYNQRIQAGGAFGYCGPPGTLTDPCTWNLLGNTTLKPETSNTTTIGIVLTPRNVLPGFQFSADWWHIKITNAIEQANPTLVQDGCRAGIMQYCNQIDFNQPAATAIPIYESAGLAGSVASNAVVSQLNPTSYNGAFYEMKGIDFSLNYLLDLGKYGTLDTRMLTTWTDEQKFQEACVPSAHYCPTYSVLGQTGTGNNFLNDVTPAARWRGSLMVTWNYGSWSFTPNMQFVSHGIMDYLGVTPADGKAYTELLNGTLPYPYSSYGLHAMPYNYVPSYFLFGLNGSYQFQNFGPFRGLQLFAQINNLLNKTPPFAAGAGFFGPGNATGGTNPIFFDTMGLAYRVGFRVKFD